MSGPRATMEEFQDALESDNEGNDQGANTYAWQAGSFFSMSTLEEERIRLIDGPASLIPILTETIKEAWPKGIKHQKQVSQGVWQWKLGGSPWASLDPNTRRLYTSVLRTLYAEGHRLYSSTISMTERDGWVFKSGPKPAKVGVFIAIDIWDTDRIRIVDAPLEVINELRNTINLSWEGIQSEVQEHRKLHVPNEDKGNKTPTAEDDKEGTDSPSFGKIVKNINFPTIFRRRSVNLEGTSSGIMDSPSASQPDAPPPQPHVDDEHKDKEQKDKDDKHSKDSTFIPKGILKKIGFNKKPNEEQVPHPHPPMEGHTDLDTALANSNDTSHSDIHTETVPQEGDAVIFKLRGYPWAPTKSGVDDTRRLICAILRHMNDLKYDLYASMNRCWIFTNSDRI